MTTSDWIDLAVAVGTIALAAAAFWQIVGDARSRPDLTLEVEDPRVHTRLEGQPPRMPWVRLLVTNGHGRRAAHGARVLVQWYTQPRYTSERVSLAGPELGWPSTTLREGDGAVIFGGMSRPLDFGALGVGPVKLPDDPPTGLTVAALTGGADELAEGQQWWFRFTLAMHGRSLFIGREFLSPVPGGYTARVTLGADDGRAKDFDVVFDWVGNAPNPESALGTVLISITPVNSSESRRRVESTRSAFRMLRGRLRSPIGPPST